MPEAGVGRGARPVRIANCSGFLGDRLAAAREMVDGGPIDVLTGDWLAELTMLILARQRLKHGVGAGYARPFITQMTDVLGDCLQRGIKVVSNAGGLDPQGCADALREVAAGQGLNPRIAVVTGDDLMGRLDVLGDARNLATGETLAEVGWHPLTANAYLGGFGVTAALVAGADVVITGRVTDAGLVSGAAAWWHGWTTADLDPLAGAVAAGHVIECGAQATGGNYAFVEQIEAMLHPGFPIAEIHADGSSVITKHPGTDGAVTVGTVTAQLLYEIASPRYLGPDVVARFDTAELSPDGPDRVRIRGVRGEPAPPDLKVCVTTLAGFGNRMSLVLTGLDVEAKADLIRRQLAPVLDTAASAHTRLEPAGAYRWLLHVMVRDNDPKIVGRRFSSAVVEMALGSVPGLYPTAPPADATPVGVLWPTSVPAGLVTQLVCLDGSEVAQVAGGGDPSLAAGVVDPPTRPWATGDPPDPGAESETIVVVALGRVAGARSGDKGGDANVGVWVPDAAAWDWLVATVDADWVRAAIPDAGDLEIEVFPIPALSAVNVVIHGLLGRGVAENSRDDPQGKGLGEWLRAQPVAVPARLLADQSVAVGGGSSS